MPPMNPAPSRLQPGATACSANAVAAPQASATMAERLRASPTRVNRLDEQLMSYIRGARGSGKPMEALTVDGALDVISGNVADDGVDAVERPAVPSN